MLKKLQIHPNQIKKVKYFDDCVVIYLDKELWVCEKDQSLEQDKNGLITLDLKDKSDTNGQK